MRTAPETNARAQEIWQALAPRYDRSMARYEHYMLRDGRAWVAARAHGRVLEVAVGTGLSLRHYPGDVEVVGVDLSEAMLRRAYDRAGQTPAPVTLLEASATQLPFSDASFDSVVCELALCCVPDERTALVEMRRVLRPGGTLLLLDHVISHRLPVRTLQRLAEPLLVRTSGDHQLRRPVTLLPAVGFTVQERDRYRLGIIERATATRMP